MRIAFFISVLLGLTCLGVIGLNLYDFWYRPELPWREGDLRRVLMTWAAGTVIFSSASLMIYRFSKVPRGSPQGFYPCDGWSPRLPSLAGFPNGRVSLGRSGGPHVKKRDLGLFHFNDVGPFGDGGNGPATPDVIGCLQAVEPLDLRYRAWMQQQCVGVAGDICATIDQGTGACLSDLVGSTRAFYADLLPLLPPEIDGRDFAVRAYERALDRAADTFENTPECTDLGGYEFTACEYIESGVATIDLLYRARLTDTLLR